MPSLQLFLPRYRELHQRLLPRTLEGLDEAFLRSRPAPAANPPAWILWHLARSEDVGVNRLVTDGTQVLDEGGWPEKLGVDSRLAGTGMTRDEVTDLAQRIRLDQLDAYRHAVHRKTLTTVEGLSEAQLAEIVPAPYVDRVLRDEGALPASVWSYLELYHGHPRAWFLTHLALTHAYYHAGQLGLLRRLGGGS